MTDFSKVIDGVSALIKTGEHQLISLSDEVITKKRNSQNRTIKQILGHLVDSATNNTHRIIHLQNQKSPLQFPNYATYGNNDRWIAIQNYQDEDWTNLIQLWKYSNLHFIHVVRNVDKTKLENVWESDSNEFVSLGDMITGYLPHLQLHLDEIRELSLKS
jgi:hypothetical protein